MHFLMIGLHAQLIGGLERYTRDVALALRHLGHQVRVISALEPSGEFPGWEGFPVQGLAPANALLYRAFFRVRSHVLRRHLRGEHAYDVALIMHPFAAEPVRQAGIEPYWVWTYGSEVWGKWSPALAAGMAGARRIVAISSHTKATVAAHLPRHPITLLPPIVDVVRLTPADPPRVPAPPYRLLTVGRLVDQTLSKGHDLVIRNLTAIQQQVGTPVEYWIAGDGPGRARLEALVNACGVADAVRFLGRVSDDRLPEIYRACDVFVMPSACEGFGIVYLEAAACGLPVIGSTVGGAVDAVEEGVTGFCVNPGDERALVETCARLLSDPVLARQMGLEGRRRVEARFSPAALDRALAELIDADLE